MFDFITLSGLWFFTAGISLIMYWSGQWPGGIHWFWNFNMIMAVVLGWELYVYLKYGVTLTRLITKAETDKPEVVKHKWIARLIVISYMIGFGFLGVHLWPF